MHEEPLRLIPPEWRDKALVELGVNGPADRTSTSRAISTRRAG